MMHLEMVGLPPRKDHHAIVTRMSALQDIASMDVLCSDKTGTLTTAKMSIWSSLLVGI